jgi:ABC-2 type transport system ATP-binding protein
MAVEPARKHADAPPAVAVRGLTKSYGAVRALDGLDLQIPIGGVFGLLGPNGAGKSTFLRLLLGLIRPSSGELRLLGRSPGREVATRIGGSIESPRFHPFLTGLETLDSLALMAGVRPTSNALLERVGLAHAAALRVDTYSLGMKQRLAIAAALIGDPELIILDEPLNGLDPAGILEMRSLIRALGEREGATVIVSSHLLDEVERVCDHIAIVHRGSLVLEGRVQDLLSAQAVLRLRGEPRDLLLRIAGPAARIEGEEVHVTIPEEATPALISALCAAGVALYEASWHRPSLEALFLEETRQ